MNARALLMLAAFLMASAPTMADDRFASEGGATLSGANAGGAGSVAIHHNLLPDSLEEIKAELDALRAEIEAFNTASLKADDERASKIAAIKPVTELYQDYYHRSSCYPGEWLFRSLPHYGEVYCHGTR